MSDAADPLTLQWCEALARSSLGTAMRTSRWGFAVTEMVHLLALAALGGGVLVVALRAGEVLLRERPLAAVIRDFAPWIGGALVVSFLSGVLLFADGPLRYYANVAFRSKLVLLGAALALGGYALQVARHAAAADAPAVGLRLSVLFDATLWLAVGIAGRVIGLL